MLPDNLPARRQDQVTDVESARHLLESVYKTGYVNTTVNDLTLHPDGTVEFLPVDGEPKRLPFAQNFLESLAKHIRMPLGYAYDVSYPLFTHNFHRRKAECSRGISLCTCRDTVIDSAPANYPILRAPTISLLDAMSFNNDSLTFDKACLSDEGISINLLHPTHIVEPQPGDAIRTGVRFTNSETGGRHAKAVVYTERLVCSNGAVLPDCIGTVWWSTDRRMHEHTKLKSFATKLATLVQCALPEAASLYEGIVDRAIFERDFVHLFRRMQYLLHSSQEVDRILAVDSNERSRIQARVRDLDPGDPGDPIPWPVFDLHNRITAEARTITASRRSSRFSLRQRLEEIGGNLLLFSRN